MNERELAKVKKAIIARIISGDAPAPSRMMGGAFVDTLFRQFSLNRVAFYSQHSGVIPHAEAQEQIAAIVNFYEAITPEEIRVLNTQCILCLHCRRMLTQDEFPEVTDPPFLLISPLYGMEHERTGAAYCSACMYQVPLIRTLGKSRPGDVYLARTADGYKIGWSGNPEQRMIALRKDYGDSALLHSLSVEDAYIAERHLHLIFWHRHIDRELFNLTDQEIAHFKRIAS